MNFLKSSVVFAILARMTRIEIQSFKSFGNQSVRKAFDEKSVLAVRVAGTKSEEEVMVLLRFLEFWISRHFLVNKKGNKKVNIQVMSEDCKRMKHSIMLSFWKNFDYIIIRFLESINFIIFLNGSFWHDYIIGNSVWL